MRLLFFVLFPFFIFSQQGFDLRTFDYHKADSLALHFPKKKYKTATEIAAALTENLKTDHEKFRAIFRWITDNIEYNRSAQNITDADKVLRKNRTVCQGFSNLLKEMCDAVNISCEVIAGYTKTDIHDINKKLKKTDHAWNCVKLYDTWYLVDVTWATSKYNVVTRRFMKDFDGHYFLTPPDKFILDHYPQDKKYQFLPKEIKKKEFIRWPVYYADYFHFNIRGISPDKGLFKWDIKKPLRVLVESETSIKDASVLLNWDSFVSPVELKYDTALHRYYFDYIFEKAVKTDFTVYLNGACIVEYVIRVK